MSMNRMENLPPGWCWVKLGDVCEARTGIRDPSRNPGAFFSYVDISCIDSDAKRISGASVLLGKDAPSRARQIILKDDVIVSTTRPNLNAVALVPPELDGQICSTGFCVLRAEEKIDPSYLFAFVRSSDFVEKLSDLVRGALYPAVTDKQVRSQSIPLPPLPEQKRITAILTEQMAAVEKARVAAEERLKVAKELPAAYLREVFESEEAQGWQRRALGEVCDITASMVDPKKKDYSSLPHVFGNNIESGMSRLTYLNSAAEDGMTSGKYLFKAGDVLYSKLRPYLRKVIVAEFDGLCSADMYPIEVNHDILDPHFTAWMLLSDEFTKYADEQSRRARMPKLNRDQLFAWEAPIPPLSIQRQLIDRHRQKIAQVEILQRLVQEEREKVNLMPAALLRRAFQGEL